MSDFAVSIPTCFFCLEGKNELIMSRVLTKHVADKVRDMHGKVVDMEPCADCQEIMDRCVILITFDPEKSDTEWFKEAMPNPYRTGGWFGVTEECILRVIDDADMAQWAINHRWMFIEHEAAVMLGLFEMAATKE